MLFGPHYVRNLGFFNWEVSSNRLTGDENLAALFGVTVDQVISGLPVEEIMARIVPRDRERVTLEVHSGILSGEARLISYTIFDSFRLKEVMSIGRCLRDRDGKPSFYTGTVCERPNRRQHSTEGVAGGNVLSFKRINRSGEPS